MINVIIKILCPNTVWNWNVVCNISKCGVTKHTCFFLFFTFYLFCYLFSFFAKGRQVKMATASRSMQLLEESVVISIKKMVEDLAPVSSERCIYRVPMSIRNVNEAAYTPRVVSVGPLHRGRKGLEAMEQQKLRYLQSFLTRANLKMENLVKLLSNKEEQVRKCYVETVELSGKKIHRNDSVRWLFRT